jgi:hypothetical protein
VEESCVSNGELSRLEDQLSDRRLLVETPTAALRPCMNDGDRAVLLPKQIHEAFQRSEGDELRTERIRQDDCLPVLHKAIHQPINGWLLSTKPQQVSEDLR